MVTFILFTIGPVLFHSTLLFSGSTHLMPHGEGDGPGTITGCSMGTARGITLAGSAGATASAGGTTAPGTTGTVPGAHEILGGTTWITSMPISWSLPVFLSIGLSSQFVLREYIATKANSTLARSASNCLHLTSDHGGAFTAAVQVGEQKRTVNLVVDTGSPYLLIDQSIAPSSVELTGSKRTIAYGSGTVSAAEGKDVVQIGSEIYTDTLYVITAATYDFPNIQGILPLGAGAEGVVHQSGFSICLAGNGGTLSFGASGATVPASSDWTVGMSGMSVNGQSAGIHGHGVVDSGTTLLCGPLGDLDRLFTFICAKWANCQGDSAVDFIDSVRSNCGSGLPALDIELQGTTLTLPGSALVIRYGGQCDVAFDTFDQEWILGQPVFHEYKVSFDSSAHKVGFQHGGCSGCGTSLAKESAASTITPADTVRTLDGPPRRPTRQQKRVGLSTEEKANIDLVRLAEKLDYAKRFKH